MTVHARKQNGERKSGGDGGASGAPPQTAIDAQAAEKPPEHAAGATNDAQSGSGDEEEETRRIVTAADINDGELLKLLPELAEDEDGMTSLKTLRDIQASHDSVFQEYMQAKQELEERFEARFAPIFNERRSELARNKLPDFWSRCVENCDILASNITDKDALALHYLSDLRCETITSDTTNTGGLHPGSFVLYFTFRENPFFTNNTLTKTYAMPKDNFDDFPEARGCDIHWKPGKNLTVRTFRKKGKNGRTFVKLEPADSFFNFFSPPDGLSADDDMKSDIENVVEADVELGEAIRNDLIPRALFYYLDLEEDDEDSDDEEEEEDDDDDDNDNEGMNGGRGGRGGGRKSKRRVQNGPVTT